MSNKHSFQTEKVANSSQQYQPNNRFQLYCISIQPERYKVFWKKIKNQTDFEFFHLFNTYCLLNFFWVKILIGCDETAPGHMALNSANQGHVGGRGNLCTGLTQGTFPYHYFTFGMTRLRMKPSLEMQASAHCNRNGSHFSQLRHSYDVSRFASWTENTLREWVKKVESRSVLAAKKFNVKAICVHGKS